MTLARRTGLHAPSPVRRDASHLMDCRVRCGACCIAPSISSPMPGMPDGKPAGVRCVQLTDDLRCALWGLPERPAVCTSLRASEDWCGRDGAEAHVLLDAMEIATRA